MSAARAARAADSNGLAGTHEGTITKTRSGRSAAASRNQRTPVDAEHVGDSCGSQTTVVVPCGTTAARELRPA